MMSVVCGSYSGHDSVALCRIPVPRLEHNHQVGSREMCDYYRLMTMTIVIDCVEDFDLV